MAHTGSKTQGLTNTVTAVWRSSYNPLFNIFTRQNGVAFVMWHDLIRWYKRRFHSHPLGHFLAIQHMFAGMRMSAYRAHASNRGHTRPHNQRQSVSLKRKHAGALFWASWVGKDVSFLHLPSHLWHIDWYGKQKVKIIGKWNNPPPQSDTMLSDKSHKEKTSCSAKTCYSH